MKKRSKLVRVPVEFDNWTKKLAIDLSNETGVLHNRQDTLRKLSKSPVTTKRGKIDWRLL